VRKKLIERFTIEINNKELGYGVKSLTGINMDSKKRDNIIQELFKTPGVREVSEVTGRFDILITMYAENLNEMYRIVSDNIGKIDGIISSESFIEMKTRTKQMPYMLE
jgi:Lrp/AsnC family transcriptional regulator for asnA, asnC and gidA